MGPLIARNLRRRQRRPGDIWHLDEVVVVISGRKFWLWRGFDQDSTVLEGILQSRRNKRAAKRLLRSLIKRFRLPKRIVIDKLRSYGAAKREVAPGLENRSHTLPEGCPGAYGRRSVDDVLVSDAQAANRQKLWRDGITSSRQGLPRQRLPTDPQFLGISFS